MKKTQKNNLAAPSQPEKALPVNTPYKVFDSDIVARDKEIADYYKTSMKMLVMRFQLVGSFNNSGQYVIKDEIKYDLVKMHKEISDSGADFYKAVVVYMKKYFYFDVKISMVDDKTAKASLFLSEFVDDALQESYIVSHIADFIDEYDASFRIKVRKAFNLEDVAIINEDFYISNLAILMQEEYDINKYVGNLYDIASQIYIMRMLKLLEGAGPLGQEIIKRYKELIIDKEEEYKDDKFKYSRFKYLLDRAINEKGGLEKLPIPKERINDIVQEVNKSVRAIDNLQSRAGAVEVMRPQGKSDKNSQIEEIFGKSAGNGSKSGKKSSSSSSSSSKGKSKSKSDTKSAPSKGGGGIYVDDGHSDLSPLEGAAVVLGAAAAVASAPIVGAAAVLGAAAAALGEDEQEGNIEVNEGPSQEPPQNEQLSSNESENSAQDQRMEEAPGDADEREEESAQEIAGNDANEQEEERESADDGFVSQGNIEEQEQEEEIAGDFNGAEEPENEPEDELDEQDLEMQ